MLLENAAQGMERAGAKGYASEDGVFHSYWPVLDRERWEGLRKRMVDEISAGLSLSRFATETGFPIDYLDAWLKTPPSKYPSDRAAMGEKCPTILLAEALEASFARLDDERQQHKRKPARVETNVTRAVMEGIATARAQVETVLIDAEPGLGKTEGVREYIARARKNEGFDCPVWHIELDEYSLSHKAVLIQIAEQCMGGKRFDDRTEHSVFRAILEATEGKGGVLIIDEAQHIADAAKIAGIAIINGLRRFPDRGCFGVVPMGNGEIYRRLSSEKYAQLLSRMEAWRVDIAGLGKGKNGQPALIEDDVDAVMQAWGVSGIKERQYCISAVKQPGALRNITNAFRRSLDRFETIDASTLNRIKRI